MTYHDEFIPGIIPGEILGTVMLTVSGVQCQAKITADGRAILEDGEALKLSDAQYEAVKDILRVAKKEESLLQNAKAPGELDAGDAPADSPKAVAEEAPELTAEPSAEEEPVVRDESAEEKEAAPSQDLKKKKKGSGKGLFFVIGLVVGILVGAGAAALMMLYSTPIMALFGL